MFTLINSDIKRCLVCEGVSLSSVSQKMFTLIFSYGLHAVIVYRLGIFLDSITKKSITLIRFPLLGLYQILDFYIRTAYAISIDISAEIGKGFYIGHFGGIEIGPCQIGDNCSVHQQVKIGVSIVAPGKSCPKIGNNVWIGSNARILSGVTISDNATVVVGAVVKKDMPARSLIMGNPARVVNKNYDNSSLTALL